VHDDDDNNNLKFLLTGSNNQQYWFAIRVPRGLPEHCRTPIALLVSGSVTGGQPTVSYLRFTKTGTRRSHREMRALCVCWV
jgi:hypothetical protein